MAQSWLRSLFLYFFASSPQDQLQQLQQLQLAQQQLEAVQNSKEALVDAFEHFSKKLIQLRERKEDLEEERLDDLIECDTQEEKEYLEALDVELAKLDEKILVFEQKLQTMTENIDFLDMSERKTQHYIDTLYEELRYSAQEGSIEWNREEFDLGDLTVDTFPTASDGHRGAILSTPPSEHRAVANRVASLQV
mmetsp:Transcript_1900/g.6779  ORF Transcript_1900/g.6779 Transcript_1900/m.6779 type:complete len:193 (-) Transcript_1900:3425-4003(-)